jgi:hypothetical protein
MPEAVSTTKDAIWRDVPDADEGLHYAHTLSNKTPLVTVGGGATKVVVETTVLLAI